MFRIETLGEKLAYLRKKAGVTQRELMDTLQFENLHKYEKDKREPNIEILSKLAKYFNVSTDWLLGLDTDNLDLSEEEINFIIHFRKLPEKEKLKIEGMVELKLAEMQD